jgi:hypothetical protein
MGPAEDWSGSLYDAWTILTQQQKLDEAEFRKAVQKAIAPPKK